MYQTDNVWYVVVSTAVKKKVKVAADHREREREAVRCCLCVV